MKRSTRREPAPEPRDLSELEGVCIGLIRRLGACTAYDVRRRLAESPSTQWSASAGAIYPLFRRLEQEGLLRPTTTNPGVRRQLRYAVTPAGLAALRRWLGPPIPPAAVTVSHDPLRTRAGLLDLMPPARRRQWLSHVRAVLDEVERRVEAWNAANHGKPLVELLTDAGRADVAARRAWVTRALSREPQTRRTQRSLHAGRRTGRSVPQADRRRETRA